MEVLTDTDTDTDTGTGSDVRRESTLTSRAECCGSLLETLGQRRFAKVIRVQALTAMLVL